MKNYLVPQPGGVTVATTTSGTAANVVLPTLAGGSKCRYLMLTVEVGKEIFVAGVVSGSEPADSALMHMDSNMNPFILNVGGKSHYRVLQKTAAAIVYATPLANT